MTRYVVSSRRAGRSSAEQIAASRHEMAATLSNIQGNIVSQRVPEDDASRMIAVIEAASIADIERTVRATSANVIIEPEILHYPVTVPPRDLSKALASGATSATAQAGSPVQIAVTGGGAPLRDAHIVLYFRGAGQPKRLEARSNRDGLARFAAIPGYTPSAALVVPRGGFWTMIARGMELSLPI